MLKSTVMSLFCSALVLAGCGGSDETGEAIQVSPSVASDTGMTPEEVATAFFEAGRAEDEALFMSYMTAKARRDLAADPSSSINLSGDAVGAYTVATATIDGDEAQVPVTMEQSGTDQRGTLKMRQDDGAWRIYAMALSMAEGMEITINFEQMESMMDSFTDAMGDALQGGMESAMTSILGGSEEDIQAHAAKYAALKSVSAESYRASWMNEADFSGIPAQEVLETLAARMGLTVDVVGLEETLAVPVAESLEGLSNMEAFERVCAARELYPLYPDIQEMTGGFGGAMVEALAKGLADVLDSEDSAISIEGVDGLQDALDEELSGKDGAGDQILLKAGKRPYPVDFAGPYMVEIAEVTENAPNPTGSVRVAARTFGVDAGVLAVQDLLYDTMRIESVADARGRSLANTDISYLSSPVVKGTAATDSASVDLVHLLRDVTRLDRIAGSYRVLVPERVDEVVFAESEVGEPRAAGELTVTLKTFGESSMIEITGPESQTKNAKILYLPVDGDGNPMAVQFTNTQAWSAGRGQSQLNTAGVPANIRMKVISKATIESYPFEVKETPLTRYAEMPEKIEELAFAGHDAPVTIAFQEITKWDPNFNEVRIRIRNESNKDAMQISAIFTYLDADGAELKEFPHSLNGVYSSSGQLPIAMHGAQVDEDTTAFFMPPETEDIRIQVDEVEFSDGSVWKAAPE
jgi:hypothetical protein